MQDKELKKRLRGFVRQGVLFTGGNSSQAHGTCPFTGKRDKFYVNPKTLMWDSKMTGQKGNYLQFLDAISKRNMKEIRSRELQQLADDRGLPIEAFQKFNIGKFNRDYTLPIYNSQGKLQDLRMYQLGKRIMSSPDCHTGLLGMNQLVKAKKGETVYLCEGEWDLFAVNWLFHRIKKNNVVVATPGASTFKADWVQFFRDKKVVVLYDNDEAGESGQLTVMHKLFGQVNALYYLNWPVKYTAGFDIRDFIIKEAIKSKKPNRCFSNIKKMLSTNPTRKPVTTMTPEGFKSEDLEFTPDLKMDLTKLIKTFTKWLSLRPEAVQGIEIAAATVLSINVPGDPVWMFIIAPPGGAKTEIISAFAECPETYMTSSLTPHALISGQRLAEGEDPSLIPDLNEKCLLVKDFTSILGLKDTVKEEIFAILRDAYDGECGKDFGNGKRPKYKSHFGILAAVTPEIYMLGAQHASLGERFLKFCICENLDDDTTDQVSRSIDNEGQETGMRKELRDAVRSFVYIKKKRMLKYGVKTELPEDLKKAIIALVTWGSRMRGTVQRSKFDGDMILSRPYSEVGTRLGKSMAKLSKQLAYNNGKKKVSEYEYRMVRKCVLDSISQRNEDIIRVLYKSCPTHNDALLTKELSLRTRYPVSTILRVMNDLVLLDVVDRLGGSRKASWTISKKTRALMKTARLYTSEQELSRPLKSRRRRVRLVEPQVD